MMQRTLNAIALLATPTAAVSVGEGALARANPVRKVVTLLQNMQKKVAAEGEKEKELYDKFMCYCTGGSAELEAAITAAEEKVPAVGSNIEATEGKLSQLKSGLAEAQASREAAKDAVEKATAVREKEASAFASEKSDLDTNIAAIGKAVAALEKGAGSSFMQTAT